MSMSIFFVCVIYFGHYIFVCWQVWSLYRKYIKKAICVMHGKGLYTFFLQNLSIYLNSIFFGFETLATKLFYVGRFGPYLENKL